MGSRNGLFLFLALCGMGLGSLHSAIPAAERAALIALYNSTNGDAWTNRSGWKTPPLDSDGFAMPGTEGTWYGIEVTTCVSRIDLRNNHLSGSIPPELGNLTDPYEIVLHSNQLSGPLPRELGRLSGLTFLHLANNRIGGTIPAELGRMVGLIGLWLDHNELTGAIPPELGNLHDVEDLTLGHNHLSGRVPAELAAVGSAAENIVEFDLECNQLVGEIPAAIGGMNVNAGWLWIAYNGLYTADPGLSAYLDAKAPGWSGTQTVAPAGVAVRGLSPTRVEVSWEPIAYASDPGDYLVYFGTDPGGPFALCGTSTSKRDSALQVGGLDAGATYYFLVRSRTFAGAHNANAVVSGFSDMVSITLSSLLCTVTVIPSGNGHTDRDGRQSVPVGGSLTIVASADRGWRFAGWSGAFSGLENPLTLNDIRSDLVIYAQFANDPPRLRVTNPVNGATLRGFVAITVEASDDSAVDSLTVTVDGRELSAGGPRPRATGRHAPPGHGQPEPRRAVPVATFDWDTTRWSNGAHTVRVAATDDGGLATEAVLAVTVANVRIALQALRLEERAWIIRKPYGRIGFTVSEAAGVPVTGFAITRREAGGEYRVLQVITPSALQDDGYVYLDAAIQKTAAYTYRILAVGDGGRVLGASNEADI